MDLVYKQNLTDLKPCQHRHHVRWTLDGRARGNLDLGVHLVGDNVSQRGLTEAGRAMEQGVVKRLSTKPGCRDGYLQVGLESFLADIFVQSARAQARVF